MKVKVKEFTKELKVVNKFVAKMDLFTNEVFHFFRDIEGLCQERGISPGHPTLKTPCHWQNSIKPHGSII